MPLIRTLSTTLVLLLALAPAVAAPQDEARLASYRRASACVAVLKQDVLQLRERYRAGTPAVRRDMVRLTEYGFGFIGTAYKAGLRNPQADQLLQEAETAQKRQDAESLRRLSGECQNDGARLMQDANVIERALVSNRAKARVEHLLAP